MRRLFNRPILGAALLISFVSLAWYLAGQAYEMIRSPQLQVLEPKNTSQISGTAFTVVGKTDPGVIVSINGASITVIESGEFRQVVSINPGQVSNLHLQAVDRFGKQSEKDIVVVSDAFRREELVYAKE